MNRRRRLAFVLLGGAASMAAVFGCSLVVDTSGLAGSAAVDSAAAPGSETGADANVVKDGATEGTTGTDGGAACNATFCDDFDDGPLGARWTRSVLNTGKLDFAMKFVSPPNALRARFFGTDAPEDRYALLERELGMGTHVRCDFSLYVSARANKDANDVFRIRTTAPGIAKFLLDVVVPSNGGIGMTDDIVNDNGTCMCPQKSQFTPGFDDAEWKRVTVVTDFTSVQMSVEGAVVINYTFGPIVPSTPIVVGLGGRAFSSITSDTLFDDFSCTLTP